MSQSTARGFLTGLVAPLLKVPTSPPEVPPGHASTARVFRAADAYLTYRYAALLFGSALSVVGLGVGLAVTYATGEWIPFVLLAVAAAVVAAQLAISFAVVRLDWELRYYVVTDRSLRIREGAWVLREITLTFLNVQNVSVQQGPLERVFGFSNVVVQTAGGGGGAASAQGGATSGHRAVLRGIVNAAEVRDLIRARLEAARRDAGLGDHDDHAVSGSELGAQLSLLREVRAETAALAKAFVAHRP